MLVRPEHGGIHGYYPVHVSDGIVPGDYVVQDLCPRPVQGPDAQTIMTAGFLRTIAFRDIAPRGTGA
ncbi:hypothetical protein StoSoilB5_19720 [Arthrobacter sp. StoSoilB5]|nr:hypothetical protein StoSoilB5_19720 [Arthrobacter sp. StoSoilB5]